MLGIIVIGTGLLGWLLNIVLVLCSGPLYDIYDDIKITLITFVIVKSFPVHPGPLSLRYQAMLFSVSKLF
jgi:hypothetical protein